jgi:type IV pilus assembly protein PilV
MRCHSIRRSKGFNLIEAMVALIVISVGLLGIAKMQALAMSSTGTAKMRSLAALESASLASAIRADRTYWSGVTGPGNTVVTFKDGAVSTSTDATLAVTKTCETASACTTITDMVAYDLSKWATELAAQMPNYTATLTCVPGTVTVPVTCTVVLNWAENRVALNSQSTGAPVLINTYTLYVEP